MNERDDYQRFKDDPPIEGRLLGYLAVLLRALIKIILPSDHCNTLVMCDNSEMICIPGYGRHKAIKRVAISQPHRSIKRLCKKCKAHVCCTDQITCRYSFFFAPRSRTSSFFNFIHASTLAEGKNWFANGQTEDPRGTLLASRKRWGSYNNDQTRNARSYVRNCKLPVLSE